mmetsp:Transcript_39191/g.101373  ORF Transcript_39191/g.101373 Transcript_39191/m.101373 type:complete len:262 (+) Transcript_39191:545-1330(+)
MEQVPLIGLMDQAVSLGATDFTPGHRALNLGVNVDLMAAGLLGLLDARQHLGATEGILAPARLVFVAQDPLNLETRRHRRVRRVVPLAVTRVGILVGPVQHHLEVLLRVIRELDASVERALAVVPVVGDGYLTVLLLLRVHVRLVLAARAVLRFVRVRLPLPVLTRTPQDMARARRCGTEPLHHLLDAQRQSDARPCPAGELAKVHHAVAVLVEVPPRGLCDPGEGLPADLRDLPHGRLQLLPAQLAGAIRVGPVEEHLET